MTTRLTLRQRLGIAVTILRGRHWGNVGERTVCTDYKMGDGSPAYHQRTWELNIVSGEANCSGCLWIGEKKKGESNGSGC